MTDWPRILLAIEPRSSPAIRAGFAASMDQCVARASLVKPVRVAHFLAQGAHESAGFKTCVEYWGPTAAQKRYEFKADLGNVRPGDGKLFMGRGIFQLTGRANYRKYGAILGVDLENNPARAAAFPEAGLIAAEYWRARNINAAADRDDLEGVTRLINGGRNGLADRGVRLARAKQALANLPAALETRATEESVAGKRAKKKAGTIATGGLATQTGHAAPEAVSGQWVMLGVFGAALLFVAFRVWRKSVDHEAVAKTLQDVARQPSPEPAHV